MKTLRHYVAKPYVEVAGKNLDGRISAKCKGKSVKNSWSLDKEEERRVGCLLRGSY